jgi:hypothetical protein
VGSEEWKAIDERSLDLDRELVNRVMNAEEEEA